MDAETNYSLATQLGLSGSWLQVTRDALLSTDLLLHPGCYFLNWDNHGLVWAEGLDRLALTDARDGAYGIMACHRLLYTGHERTTFLALKRWPLRVEMLREFGFADYQGWFKLMELVSTPLDKR